MRKTGKCHGNMLSAMITDKDKVKKLFNRFKTIGKHLSKPIQFEIKPWYRWHYSKVINAASEMLTFYIPVEIKQKIETAIGKELNSGDRLLLEVNKSYFLIVKLSKHDSSFNFTIARQKAKKYKIKKSVATKFRLFKVAKYEEIVNKIIDEYKKGKSVPTLELNYPFGETYIRKILIKNGINVRSLSEQQTIKHHGHLPHIKDGLSEGKLKIIFAILGDNVGNIKSKGYGIGIVGELDFIKAFADEFEKEYGIRPSIRKEKNHEAFKAILGNKNIFNDLRQYAIFGSHEWKLLENAYRYIEKMDVVKLGKAVAYFWEAEGCAVVENKMIEATSVNYNGLLQIQKIMNILGIKTSITGPNYAASSNGLYTIRVSGLENIKTFGEKVNFVTQRKRKEIKKLLTSYKRFVKIHTFEEYKKAFELKKKKFTLKEISSILNISPRTLKTWFYEGVKPNHPNLQSYHSSSKALHQHKSLPFSYP